MLNLNQIAAGLKPKTEAPMPTKAEEGAEVANAVDLSIDHMTQDHGDDAAELHRTNDQ